MKKAFLLFFLTTALLCTIGCKEDVVETTRPEQSTQTETSTEELSTAEPSTEAVSQLPNSETVQGTTEAVTPAITTETRDIYVIKELTMVGDAYTLSFPQLEGGDEITCHFYNWLWQRLAEDYAAQTTVDPSLSYTLNFQVMTHTEDLLSILFKGQSVYADAAYPTNFFVTYNIDLRTGETLRLADSKELSKISKALAEGKFTFPDNYAYVSEFKNQIFAGYDASMLSSRLASADYEVALTKGGLMLTEDQRPSDFTYYKDGELCILVQVVHALGDYVAVIPTN